jgi:hypothetical protein
VRAIKQLEEEHEGKTRLDRQARREELVIMEEENQGGIE